MDKPTPQASKMGQMVVERYEKAALNVLQAVWEQKFSQKLKGNMSTVKNNPPDLLTSCSILSDSTKSA